MRLGIVGGGRAAWAFASAWQASDGAIAGVSLREGSASRLPELVGAERLPISELVSRAEIVLVAVTDSALPDACRSIGAVAPESVWLVHASGSHPSELFAPHRRAFSLHPLRSLPPAGTAAPLEDALLVFEGPPEALDLARDVAVRAHARLASVDAGAKGAYHAAAVLAANYPAALLSMCERLLADAGVRGVSSGDIVALARSAIENWGRGSGSERFTGPVVRGDAVIVRKHLDLLRDRPTMHSVYASLALELCEIVLEQEPDNRGVKSVRDALLASSLP